MELPASTQQQLDELRDKFDALAVREKLALIVCAVVVVAAIAWFAALKPLQDARARLQDALIAERETAQKLEQARADLAVLRRGQGPATQGANQSVMALVDSTGRQAGFTENLRVQPDGTGEARVWLDDVSFDSTLGWIKQLDTRYGLTVTAADVSRKQTAGKVEARLTVERP